MGSKYPSPQRFKIHRNYTIGEIARMAGVHKQTVRRWESAGLQTIDDQHRPKLFRGIELRRFLAERRADAKRPMGPGEMFCFKCRAVREPFGAIADLLPVSTEMANLRGMCGCGTLMHRRVSQRTIGHAARNLTLTIPEAQSRIGDKPSPIVNANLREIWKTHANAQRAK